MSDWSRIQMCPLCDAGNPADAAHCIRCGADIALERARLEAFRKARTVPYCSVGSKNDKPINELTPADLRRHPVWRFDIDHEGEPGRDETWVKPVRKLPVTDLALCVVGTDVRLACGAKTFAMLGNIALNDLRKTQQLLSLTVLDCDGEWFDLAQYHHIDYDTHGPHALAAFLGLAVDEVFPLTYDISAIAIGLDAVVKGTIPCEPVERLSDDELMDLVLGRTRSG